MPKIKNNRRTRRINRKEIIKEGIVEVLSPTQVKRIQSVNNERDRNIILFLLNTGLRIEEAVNLNYGQLFLDIKRKIVHDSVTFVGKRKKERTVPLNREAKNAILCIDTYNRQNIGLKGITKHSAIFVSRQKNRINPRSIQVMIKNEINASPHILRHTCFTTLRKNGVPGEVIQKVAGHESYSTTVKYYLQVDEDEKKEAMNTLSFQEYNLQLALAN